MPQPLSKVLPIEKIGGTLFGAKKVLESRPELSPLVAQVISTWSTVEGFLLELFVELLGGDHTLSAKIYLRLESRSAKSAALEEVIHAVEDQNLSDIIMAIVGLSKVRQKERDKIAHHILGVVENLPDALLVVDPKEMISGSVHPSKIYVYREKDFQKLIANNIVLINYCIQILDCIRTPDLKPILLHSLSGRSEIADKLNRQARPKKSTPKGPSIRVRPERLPD